MAQDNINTAAETVVGPSVKIQGDLNSEGNIRIEGSVAGKVQTTQSVHVGEAAKLAADMQAGNAIVAGEIHGNIKVTGNLILQATARVAGDISCTILRVEDGAQFSGKCSMKGAVVDKQTGSLKPITSGNGNGKGKIAPEPEDED
jgi:cytoskeletal protein CcmA (bactofilin family)